MMYLDCTLRDGGYYTNWDFNRSLIELYLKSMEKLPVDIIEVGYRSLSTEGYSGEYFHLPAYRLKWIRALAPSKQIAVMLNEVEVELEDLNQILGPVKAYIDVVRLAVKPHRFDHAVLVAEAIRDMGLKVAFNQMYISKLIGDEEMLEKVKSLDGKVDYFNLVDSYGSVFPTQVQAYACELKAAYTQTRLGFHGHNNLELAFANSLAALEGGCDIIDGTLTGMGRGAGNLKTELWLTWLSKERDREVDFNELSTVVAEFEEMQRQYGWGTKLAYMVSGANALPQKKVMEWVTNRFYSLNSIVRALNNESEGKADNLRLKPFTPEQTFDKAIIVGGGPRGAAHAEAVKEFIRLMPYSVCLIHASSRNVPFFNDIDTVQFHCLAGNEGHRLESLFAELDLTGRVGILPPFPRIMGTYVPPSMIQKTFELPELDFPEETRESVTALAIQAAMQLKAKELLFVGYDGYSGDVTRKEMELFNENESIFKHAMEMGLNCRSLTLTKYKNLPQSTVYAYIP